MTILIILGVVVYLAIAGWAGFRMWESAPGDDPVLFLLCGLLGLFWPVCIPAGVARYFRR